MRTRRLPLRVALLAAAAAIAAGASPRAAPPGAPVPPLVFVSRLPATGADSGQVPGLGPRGRAVVTRGRLLVRSRSGGVRSLLPAGRLHDVADPAVSFDGRRIAFAGTVHRDSAWRIWVVDADGRGLRAVTRTGPGPPGPGAPAARFDDFDPTWLPDGRLCFASTRWPLTAQNGRPATNLFTVRPDGSRLERLTSDRNGAEEPSVDPATGRIVYARWWTNRWLASERDRIGLTLERGRAVPADTVNVWHAISLRPDGDGGRLAGGDPRTRTGVAAHQPAMLEDGTLVGVCPERAGFEPRGGRAALRAFRHGFAEPETLAGCGVRGASACSPAALPGGGVAFALDRDGRGDYGLWAIRPDGSGLTRLVDLRGTLELDPAPLVARPLPPIASPPRELPIPARPYRTLAGAEDGRAVPTFRFDCLNVFANGPPDSPFPDAPPIQTGVRIRFYAALARPGDATGDTAVLLREAPVTPTGGVHEEDLPGDTPMFEQLVDSRGRVLRSSLGPAHVPGMNFARAGAGTQCVGCHAGHSALAVPPNYESAMWINVSPSAEVTASSVWPGTRARAAVDRRTRGPADSVGWIGAGGAGERLRLRWATPVEVRTIVLYALRADPAASTDLVVEECEIRLFLGAREVERTVLHDPLAASGTRANCNQAVADRLEVVPLRASGRVLGRAVVGLAEIETVARIHSE